MEMGPKTRRTEGLLEIDPHASIEKAHAILRRMEGKFSRSPSARVRRSIFHIDVSDLATVMSLPSRVQ